MRQNSKRIPFYSKCSFNPRICKRCDSKARILKARKRVSIHASVKDATEGEGINIDFTHVSIHASVKDATNIIDFSIHSHKFQSTHL